MNKAVIMLGLAWASFFAVVWLIERDGKGVPRYRRLKFGRMKRHYTLCVYHYNRGSPYKPHVWVRIVPEALCSTCNKILTKARARMMLPEGDK